MTPSPGTSLRVSDGRTKRIRLAVTESREPVQLLPASCASVGHRQCSMMAGGRSPAGFHRSLDALTVRIADAPVFMTRNIKAFQSRAAHDSSIPIDIDSPEGSQRNRDTDSTNALVLVTFCPHTKNSRMRRADRKRSTVTTRTFW